MLCSAIGNAPRPSTPILYCLGLSTERNFCRLRKSLVHNLLFGELCRGKATVAYTKPQQTNKEESERLRGERDQIKLLDLKDGQL